MNNRQKATLVAVIMGAGLLLWSLAARSQDMPWRYVEDGVAFTTVDKNIWVFKIEKPFRLRIVYDEGHKTLPQWAEGWNATAAINLGMFHDGMNPSGYTKVNGIVIQSEIANYNTFMVWSRMEFKILDRTVTSMKEIMSWPNISQNIRMIKPGQDRNRWRELTKKWSVSTIAIDKTGNILLIHTRAPYNMRVFSDKLLDTNLNIEYMVYTEGGPESSVVVRGNFTNPLTSYSRMGSYETGFNENDDNHRYWYLPFALMINKR